MSVLNWKKEYDMNENQNTEVTKLTVDSLGKIRHCCKDQQTDKLCR
ncbi:hypothetical protein GWK90_06170 [Candidatus Hamiltonella defensa]|nr:hypothetical protein [Candidatus Hamiltonella defensa]